MAAATPGSIRSVEMNGKIGIRQLTLFAMLGAMMFAGKLVMAAIPNVEPVSLLVMLLAVCFGWSGLYAVAVYVLLEILVFGFQLWSISYLYVWLLLFVAAYILRRMKHPLEWALLSAAFGIGFGAFCAIPYWIVGGWAAAVSWWVAGIPWDLVHGVGNFVIALLLFVPLRKVLMGLARGFTFEITV